MFRFSNRSVRPSLRRAFFEQFEQKLNMAGIGLLVQHDVEPMTAEVGQQDVVMSELNAYAIGGNATLKKLSFAATRGTNFRGIEDFDLRADLFGQNGRRGTDGVFETVLARDVRAWGNRVDFHVGLGVDLRGVPLQVSADIRHDAVAPQKIGLGDAFGSMTASMHYPWWFRGYAFQRPIPVYTVGENPIHAVEEEQRLITTELLGPSEDVAVENQKGITLGRFTAGPKGSDPLLLTDVVYTVSQGSALNINKYQLWVDTDQNGSVDTILQNHGSVHTHGQIDFRDLTGGGYVVTAPTLFEVRGDVASSLASDALQIGLAGLGVEQLDGSEAHWVINHAPQTKWTFLETETLHVSSDTIPVPQRQVLGGTLSEALARITLIARYGAVDTYYIGIDVEGEDRSIDRFEVYREGGMTPIGIASRAGAKPGDDFGLNMQNRQLVTPEDAEDDLIIHARIKRDTEGGVSGDQFAVAVDQIMARGDVSNNEIDVVIDDIVSRPHTVVMSEFESFSNASAIPDGSAIPLGIAPTGEFRTETKTNVNFDSGPNRSLIEQLSFEYYAVGTVFDTSGFGLYKKADATIVDRNYIVTTLDYIPIVSSTVTGNFRVIYSNVASSGIDATIDAGGSAVFVAQGNILSTAQGATMQVGLSLNRGAIKWRDQDFAHSTLFDWVDLPYTTVWSTKYRN